MNVDYWFEQPLSFHQCISWVFLLISLYLLVRGLKALRKNGRPSQSRQDDALFTLEKTSALVTGSVFHYIRHPLYSSLLFLAWGIAFKAITWPGIILAMLASLFLMKTAKAEECENILYFGEAYQEYMKHTKRFLPFVY